MALLRQWIFLLALLGIGVGTTALLVPQPNPTTGQISFAEAQTLSGPVLWIDARSEMLFARGHIPGAHNLSEDNWSEQIAAVLSAWEPGQTIIVYCDSASCLASESVAERLRGPEYGLAPVQVLQGGWAEWSAQGGASSR